MSRRDYVRDDIYEERDREYSRRPRNDRRRNEIDIDIREARSAGPERRSETIVLDRRDDRRERERVPEFLREDYGRTADSQQLVIREDRREEDTYSRAPGRRRSIESLARSRGPERVEKEEIIIRERERERERRPERVVDEEIIIRERDRERERRPERVEKEEIVIRERDRERERRPERVDEEIIIRERDRERDRRPPYPSSDIGRGEREVEEIIFRDRPRSRAPSIVSRGPERTSKEEIDIRIRKNEDERPPPRSEIRERDVEEIRIRRGDGERYTPRREAIEREEIDIRESTRSPPDRRGRDREESREEIDIRIRESDRSDVSRARSTNRGAVVARKEEEWVIRRPRREPSPPPRDYEKEEIIIRRKERSISPEPEREPSPDPMPPPLEPIVRPPIVQEVITHYRNIDHGFERAREQTPPSPPSPPREKEEDLEIAIHRTGTRNGKAYDEELIIERDRKERDDDRPARRPPSIAPPSRRRYEEDDIAIEADFYNRRAATRGYPGEAYNGATKKWEVVDIPPGTERVRTDGIGGGGQEITWQRYNGERMSKFYAGDRIYEQDLGRPAAIPAPPIGRGEEKVEETRIERRTTIEERGERPRTKERMWTEVTKDLVIKEAIEESGYDFEETDQFYYVMEYLRYEDVLRLVELTEDIRRERRERIREIQWEREELERAPKLLGPPPPAVGPPPSYYDERIVEREYIYDRDGRRHRH